MQADIQEIYTNTIRPLTSDEKLRIATLILEDVTGKAPVNGARERREAMNELLRYTVVVSSGNPRAADNEQIDADLAREVASMREKED